MSKDAPQFTRGQFFRVAGGAAATVLLAACGDAIPVASPTQRSSKAEQSPRVINPIEKTYNEYTSLTKTLHIPQDQSLMLMAGAIRDDSTSIVVADFETLKEKNIPALLAAQIASAKPKDEGLTDFLERVNTLSENINKLDPD